MKKVEMFFSLYMRIYEEATLKQIMNRMEIDET